MKLLQSLSVSVYEHDRKMEMMDGDSYQLETNYLSTLGSRAKDAFDFVYSNIHVIKFVFFFLDFFFVTWQIFKGGQRMVSAPETLTIDQVSLRCDRYIEELEDVLRRPSAYNSLMIKEMMENIIEYCNNVLEHFKDEQGQPLLTNDHITIMLELYETIWDVRKMFRMTSDFAVPILHSQPI